MDKAPIAALAVAVLLTAWVWTMVPAQEAGLVPDPALADAIREECGLEEGSEITLENLESLRFLRASGRDIHSIAGLENCSSLLLLELYSNPLSDIMPLAGLTSLRTLSLDYAYVENISPLANLTNLEVLYLSSNGIQDISVLSNLTKLQDLHLGSNDIHDIGPLAPLTSLVELRLSSNFIEDVSPLAACTSLEELYLSFNRIESIDALSSLTSLERISFSGNTISSIEAVASMPSLWLLEASFNAITDITPITSCTSLRSVNLSNNSIDDLTPLLDLNIRDGHIILDNNPYPIWQLDLLAPHLNNYNISLEEYYSMVQPGGYPLVSFDYLQASKSDYSRYLNRTIRQLFMVSSVAPSTPHVHLVSPLWYVDIQKQWIVPFYCYYHIGGPYLRQTVPILPYDPDDGTPAQNVLPLFPGTIGMLIITRYGAVSSHGKQNRQLYGLVLLAGMIVGSGMLDGVSSCGSVGSCISQPLLAESIEREGYACGSDIPPEYIELSHALDATCINPYYVMGAPDIMSGISVCRATELTAFLRLCETDSAFLSLLLAHPSYMDGIMDAGDLEDVYDAYEQSCVEGKYWAAHRAGLTDNELHKLSALLEGIYGPNEQAFVRCVGANSNVLSFGFHGDGVITDEELADCLDIDGDGLTQREEILLGTDAKDCDTDNDGLPDGCEVYPFSINGVRYDLVKFGVDPLHKDILLSTVESPLEHNVPPSSYGALIESFANSPVHNPDGTSGITVHRCDPVPGAYVQLVCPSTSTSMTAWGQCPGSLQWYDAQAISSYAEAHGIDLPQHWSYLMMHELGHNILGLLDPDNQSEYGDESHSRYVGYTMFMGPTGAEGDHHSNGVSTDFHPLVWAELERDGMQGIDLGDYRLEAEDS